MKNQKGPAVRQAGYAAILIVFVLSMISVFIGISLLQTGFIESLMGRANPLSAKAFYNANSGIEEALYRIKKDLCPNPGCPTDSFNLANIGWQTAVTVTTDDPIYKPYERTIKSSAKSGLFIRKIKTSVTKGTVTSPFNYAIQAGSGGIEFDDIVNGNIVGSIHSNGNIIARKDVNVTGTVSAVLSISNKVHAPLLTPFAPEVKLPVFDLSIMQKYLEKFIPINPPTGTHTVIDGSIGDVTINGNLRLESSRGNYVTITGPVWVTGTTNINADMILDPAIDTSGIGQILVGQLPITVEKSSFPSGVFWLVISTYSPPSTESDPCLNDPSITIEANINSILYYAPNGCLNVDLPTASMTFNGSAIGKYIKFHQLQHGLIFDNDLLGAEFGLTRSGGWATTSFKEE